MKYLIKLTFLVSINVIFVLSYSPSDENRESKIIQIRGVDVEFESIGEGKPVIMIHGFGIDRGLLKGCMEPIFENLTGYKRIYFDLPGMGRTPVPIGFESSDDILEFVIEFIDKTIGDEKYLLVGNSYGGYLASALTQKSKEQIDGLILICPLVKPVNSERVLPAKTVIKTNIEFSEALSEAETNLMNDLFVVKTKRTRDRFYQEIMPGLIKSDKSFLQILRNDHNYELSSSDNNFSFHKPALILTGKQDYVVGYSDSWNKYSDMPRATFVTLDIAGHNLHIEQENLLNVLVQDLLLRIKIYQQ